MAHVNRAGEKFDVLHCQQPKSKPRAQIQKQCIGSSHEIRLYCICIEAVQKSVIFVLVRDCFPLDARAHTGEKKKERRKRVAFVIFGISFSTKRLSK